MELIAKISRRRLITGGIKTGMALAIFHELPGMLQPVFRKVTRSRQTPDRYQAAYKRLDEYVARHMAEVGARE